MSRSQKKWDKKSKSRRSDQQHHDETSYSKSEKERQEEREAAEGLSAHLDVDYGFEAHLGSSPRVAFLFNVRASALVQSDGKMSKEAALDALFVSADGSTFKATLPFEPYFYLVLDTSSISDFLNVESRLRSQFEAIQSCQAVPMIDLEQPNHLSFHSKPITLMKLLFRNVSDLTQTRNRLKHLVDKNRAERSRLASAVASSSSSMLTLCTEEANASTFDSHALRTHRQRDEVLELLIDMREYDVPYVTRVCIDLNVRIGRWYEVTLQPTASPNIAYQHALNPCPDLIAPPLIKKMAFDIETTKPPLKFPNASVDRIMMISMMTDNRGYLLVNREEVSAEIEDFEYTPSSEMQSHFTCINLLSEKSLLEEFFRLVKILKPLVFVTFNGDFFDWPFIDKRCAHHGLSLYEQIGFWLKDEEYMCKQAVHLDCFAWVKRDSYLPQGSHGLKAVTRIKLKYNPVEMDPEDMMRFAVEKPQELATYSVSDAVATYHLYVKFIHMFIFSLATIIPMAPNDVLRKGSGTLCESLLQVEAFNARVIAPNKQEEEWEKYHENRLLESETYIGGHVECIESGVFRSDIPMDFKLNVKRLQWLKESVGKTLDFALQHELHKSKAQVSNFDEIRLSIIESLDRLIQQPHLEVNPLIYHLDVGAMYPNIILTNRLQPMAMVDDTHCAACDFNAIDAPCQRRMKWQWRGKVFPASKREVNHVRQRVMIDYEAKCADEIQKHTQTSVATGATSSAALHNASALHRVPYKSSFKKKKESSFSSSFSRLAPYADRPASDRAIELKNAVKKYSQKVYQKNTVELTSERTSTVCQRENSFYVDTVRAFRDRRYEYKVKGKAAKRDYDQATAAIDRARFQDELNVYDSLQLAHKCILNSFYGYVMRRGARWHSIEMAGVVTNTGAELIKRARELIDDIGRPLELDTDGIWCTLPSSFPDTFCLKFTDGTNTQWSYPCSLLNADVDLHYTNNQYMDLKSDQHTHEQYYDQRSECSILFEVDGPYRAMILPAAREEGKNIKKRYAVFNEDGSLAELKGFEIKRRGELKLIKEFQGALFKQFLQGENLAECYAAVGKHCNYWLDILINHAANMEEYEVIDLISESKSMSDTIEEYGDKRSTSISTARRLAEFLGPEMLVDRGLNCRYVVSMEPAGTSVSDRAIPAVIFSEEEPIKRQYLRKWLKDSNLEDFDVRALVDWSYYIGRLSSAIQKIVTIPAAFQRIPNPVERVKHPDWLGKRLREQEDSHQQTKLLTFFSSAIADSCGVEGDVEDIMVSVSATGNKRVSSMRSQPAQHVAANEIRDKACTKRYKATSDMEQDKENVEQIETAAPASMNLPLVVPSHEPNTFDEWLNQQKADWRLIRQRRKKFKSSTAYGRTTQWPSTIASTSDSVLPSPAFVRGSPTLAHGLQAYLQQSVSLNNTPWQILQWIDDGIPGLFRVWVLLSPSTLVSTLVSVPRVLYFNCHVTPDPPIEGTKKVERYLPHGRRGPLLYELRMSENVWRNEQHSLAAVLDSPEVEGVYENHVSPLFALIRDLGCCAKLDRSVYDQETEYPLEALKSESLSDGPYLSSADVHRSYLYQSMSSTSQVGLFMLVLERSNTAYIITINPYRGELEKLRLIATWKQIIEQQPSDQLKTSGHETLTFKQHEVASRSEAFSIIKESLQNEKQGGAISILLCQSTFVLHELYIQMTWLKAECPIVSIPFNNADNLFPTLSWLTFASRLALERYAVSTAWWHEAVKQSRYANIPVGQLAGDFSTQALDFYYARSLAEEKHLLWSNSSDSYQQTSTGSSASAEASITHRNPVIDKPGCYRSVVMDWDLHMLSVCAIVRSDEIEDESMVTDLSEDVEDDHPIPTTSGVYNTASVSHPALGTICLHPSNKRMFTPSIKRAFEVLRHTVIKIARDGVHSPLAVTLLRDVYRWMHSVHSPLYDALLVAHVHSLSMRLHAALLSRLETLGSKIIHASFHQIMVDTGKTDPELAFRYAEFLVKTIVARPMFTGIEFVPVRAWHSILYLNRSNYAGILLPMPYADVAKEQDVEIIQDDMQDLQLSTHWRMAQCLPARCIDFFEHITAEFMSAPYNHRLTHISQPCILKSRSLCKAEESFTREEDKGTKAPEEEEEEEDCCTANIRTLLKERITTQLFNFVQAVHNKVAYNEDESDRSFLHSPLPVHDVFMTLPGSHVLIQDAALEFTKQLMHVLALDTTVAKEIRCIRDSLLRLLRVPSFSPTATFADPTPPVLLPDLCCSFCAHCEEVDLGLRANEVVLVEEQDSPPGSTYKFSMFEEDGEPKRRDLKCSQCRSKFKSSAIDEMMSRMIESSLCATQLEDHVCVQCGSMKDRYLMDRCVCGGRWRSASEGVKDRTMSHQWPIMHRLSTFFGLNQSSAMLEFLCRVEGISLLVPVHAKD